MTDLPPGQFCLELCPDVIQGLALKSYLRRARGVPQKTVSVIPGVHDLGRQLLIGVLIFPPLFFKSHSLVSRPPPGRWR